jgi:hypothetical protein
MAIDFESTRLGSADDAGLVRKVLTIVKVAKPGKQEFFRVRPGEEFSYLTQCLKWEEDGHVYALALELWPDYAEHLQAVVLRLAVNRRGEPFFVPCALPDPSGKHNTWHTSRMNAVLLAEKKWIRMSANMHLGGYDVFEAAASLSEPVWPEQSMIELLDIAFKDRQIERTDRPVLKQLRGE